MKTRYSRLSIAFLLAVLVTSHASGQEQEGRDFLSKESVQKFLNRHLSDKPQWYGLYAHDKKIGRMKCWLRNLPKNDPPAIEFTIDALTLDESEERVIESKSITTEIFAVQFPHRVLRILEKNTSGDFVEIIDVRRIDDDQKFDVKITQDGETRGESINFDYKLTDRFKIDLWCTAPRAVGDKIAFKIFDPSTLQTKNESARVTQVRKEVHGGEKVGVVECEVIDEDGYIYEETFLADGTEVRFGVSDTIVGRLEDEKTQKNDLKSFDWFVENLVPTDGVILDPSLVTRMEVEVTPELYKFLPDTSAQRKTIGQKSGGYRVTIDYSKLQNDLATPEEVRRNLKSTVTYPADHERIIELAEEAVGKAATTEEKVASLVSFVSEFIEYSSSAEPLTVLSTISIKKGDCSEHSDLFTALARSLGIPTRSVSGLIFSGDENTGNFGAHAWNEVVIDGKWVAVDPTWDETTISATHIRGDLGGSGISRLRNKQIRLINVEGSPWHLTEPQDVAGEVPQDGIAVAYFDNGKKRRETRYEDGMKSGMDTMYYGNGQKRSEVHWVKNKKEGSWAYYNRSGGKISDIRYKNSKRDGLATWWHENGKKEQEGHWKNGEQDGLATTWDENGQKKAEVHYKDGELEGLATWWHENGKKELEGHLKDGELDGLRTRWHENGKKEEEGHWKNGEQDGLTTLWHENGKKEQEANYKDGEMDGLFTNWHENGQKKAEGHYKNGKKDGLWAEWHENGKKEQEVHWKNGEPDGLATQWHANGQKEWEGNYKNGKREGLWTWWRKNGKKWFGDHYKNGKQDGLMTSWYENGQLREETHYKNDKLDGLSTTWDEDGNKTREIEYKDGTVVPRVDTYKPPENAPYVKYYANGKKKVEGHHKDGKPDGLWTEWYEDGKKKSEIHWKNGEGELRKLFSWYENGQKKVEIHYKDGKQDGLETSWYENGQKALEGHYKNGKREGLLTEWNEDGKKQWEKHSKNGKPDGLWTKWDKDGNKVLEIQYKDGREISRKEF